jgi:hypothetical protein
MNGGDKLYYLGTGLLGWYVFQEKSLTINLINKGSTRAALEKITLLDLRARPQLHSSRQGAPPAPSSILSMEASDGPTEDDIG